MHWKTFPRRITELEPYVGRFEASQIRGEGCDILFASYRARTTIEPHQHDTDNFGVITKGEMVIKVSDVEHHYLAGEWYYVAAPPCTRPTATSIPRKSSSGSKLKQRLSADHAKVEAALDLRVPAHNVSHRARTGGTLTFP